MSVVDEINCAIEELSKIHVTQLNEPVRLSRDQYDHLVKTYGKVEVDKCNLAFLSGVKITMSDVRAKMVCESVNDAGDSKQIKLRAVYDESDDNKEWSKYTPNGDCSLTITNPAAFEKFEPGEEYFVDFTKVEK